MLGSRFYIRTGPESRPMDFVEVSRAFSESNVTANRLREFRFERIARILAGDGPSEMADERFTVLHIVPLEAVGNPQRFSIRDLQAAQELVWPMDKRDGSEGIDLDGIYRLSQFPNKTHSTYSLLMRSGIIESVQAAWIREEFRVIVAKYLEAGVIKAIQSNLNIFKRLGTEPPFVVFLSLLNVRDFKVYLDENHDPINWELVKNIRRDDLHLPEVILSDWDEDIPKAMKHCFDGIWNACGLSGSNNYNAAGQWSPRA